jgi:hypothetical protein
MTTPAVRRASGDITSLVGLAPHPGRDRDGDDRQDVADDEGCGKKTGHVGTSN